MSQLLLPTLTIPLVCLQIKWMNEMINGWIYNNRDNKVPYRHNKNEHYSANIHKEERSMDPVEIYLNTKYGSK